MSQVLLHAFASLDALEAEALHAAFEELHCLSPVLTKLPARRVDGQAPSVLTIEALEAFAALEAQQPLPSSDTFVAEAFEELQEEAEAFELQAAPSLETFIADALEALQEEDEAFELLHCLLLTLEALAADVLVELHCLDALHCLSPVFETLVAVADAVLSHD